MTLNWQDISYLASGTPTQQRAHRTLTDLAILDSLSQYDAILVSTVCNDIDIPGSDLDIICYAADFAHFQDHVIKLFGSMPGFAIHKHESQHPAIVVQFHSDDFEIEIFAQDIPVTQQNAFRHMLQTNRVLTIGGERWRHAIRQVKHSGLKTEPAVAQLLNLPGDPYRALLALEAVSDAELTALIQKNSAELPTN
jgi:hypothetical protein